MLRMITIAPVLLAGYLMVVTADASESQLLWPDGAPGERDDIGEEHDTTSPDEKANRVIRLGNVTQPTITLYRAPADKDTGATVVVCPGGGYHILAMDLEGTEVCDWLNSIGVNAVLLKYRVPRRKDLAPHAAPLQDVQRALGLVRSQADDWELDPDRIGVMGFSAGGHLSAAASTNFKLAETTPFPFSMNAETTPFPFSMNAFDWVYLYTGRRLDPETGLYYFRNRYYDPTLGRFCSRDPIGYADGASLYKAYFAPNSMDPAGTTCTPYLTCVGLILQAEAAALGVVAVAGGGGYGCFQICMFSGNASACAICFNLLGQGAQMAIQNAINAWNAIPDDCV